ncbi:6-phosphogluconate dehydrogenase [Xylaria acuta]|nr:6-phosphogluconate dehydrogenase [Xylaria acuta]
MHLKKIGMLGVGSMGGAMSMLMAEAGYEVFFFDPSDENMDQLEKEYRDIHLDNKVHRTGGYDELCSKLSDTKVFVFSTPHGGPADKCVEEASNIFKSWNDKGPLRDCFVVSIGVDIERTKDNGGQHVVSRVRDKVVQDVDEEEGTGIWTREEAVARHNRKSAGSQKVKPQKLSISSREEFIGALHSATYFRFPARFARGLDLIRQKDKDKDWKLDYCEILQLWRGGCIIKAEHITDLLDKMYAREDHDPDDILGNEEVEKELSGNYQATKKVVLKAVEADLFVPSISQTLGFYKYETSTHLPTQFMEAQLDYFGSHMFERKDDPMRGLEKGEHHYEWNPAKGKSDK